MSNPITLWPQGKVGNAGTKVTIGRLWVGLADKLNKWIPIAIWTKEDDGNTYRFEETYFAENCRKTGVLVDEDGKTIKLVVTENEVVIDGNSFPRSYYEKGLKELNLLEEYQ